MNNEKARTALVVDNPYRDLPGLVLLAMSLCRHGAECYLVPMNLQRRELGSLAPDFVLLNYLRTVNQEFVRHLLEAGIMVGVLDTEGGVLSSLDAYAKTKAMAKDQAVRNRVSCFCCWGTKLAEHAKKERWYRDEQVVVTGTPRFDFYAHPWREAALQASPYVESYPRPMVLINGSFSVANPRFRTPEQEIQLLVERLGQDRKYMLQYQKAQYQTLLGMAKLTNHLAARFPRATFVYRPHPFERLETYHELLEPWHNLHLVKIGTADGWILRASALIQRGCSTAIEAGIAGVPALTPSWIPTAERFEAVDAVSIECASQTELDDQLNGFLYGERRRPHKVCSAIRQVIEDWFYAIDGAAHERVASAIVTHLNKGDSSRVRLKECREILHGRDRSEASMKSRAVSAIRMSLGLPVTWSIRCWRNLTDVKWDRSEKYFDVEKVQELVDAISACQKPFIGPSRTGVAVMPAQERGNYHFNYTLGRSVVVCPQ